MPTIAWRNLIGQDKVKQALAAAYGSGTLGHAYLFTGDEGAGKFQAALEFSMALLCQAADTVPCYACDACRRVLHYAHPDLRMIFPVTLLPEHKSGDGLTEKGWAYLAELSLERIKRPYALTSTESVPVIPVDWVREVNHAILRGPIEGGTSITIIDGVDVMNKESANSMLKILEEPPADTVFFVLTERPHAVLPTIVSRCQNMRFGYLSPGEITAALRSLCGPDVTDADKEAAARCSMGSLGRALYLAEHPVTESAQLAQRFWSCCTREDWLSFAALIDELAQLDKGYDSLERLFITIMEMTRGGALRGVAGSEKYIYGGLPSSTDGKTLTAAHAEAILRICQDAIGDLQARGNTSLVLVNSAMRMMESFHGEEQQAR